jgi:hypothetical protein
VGKYPKMNACFTPAADLARSRVYFRPEGVPSWYYVDMKTDQPCFTGTLPKPGKKLVGKKIEYYVEAPEQDVRTRAHGGVRADGRQVRAGVQEERARRAVREQRDGGGFPVRARRLRRGRHRDRGRRRHRGSGRGGSRYGGGGGQQQQRHHDDHRAIRRREPDHHYDVGDGHHHDHDVGPQDEQAPFAVLTTNPDPPSGTGPLTVTFDLCKSTDPDGDPLSYFLQLR